MKFDKLNKRVYNVEVKYILLFSIFLFLLPQQVFADNLVPLINQQRSIPLTENTLLDQSAHLKACDMVTNHYWAHNVIPRPKWSMWLTQAKYKFRYAGEDLARLNSPTPDYGIIDAWINSPEHKKVLQDPVYKEVGIGRCGNIVVAHFGTR